MLNSYAIRIILLVLGFAAGAYAPLVILYLVIYTLRNNFGIKLILRWLLGVVLLSVGLVLLLALAGTFLNRMEQDYSRSEGVDWFAPSLFVGFLIGVIFLIGSLLRRGVSRAGKGDTPPGGPAIENLLPCDAYHSDETGYWKRMPLVAGLFFGVATAISSAIFPLDDSNLLYSRTTRVLISLIGGGILFGLLFPFLLRSWTFFTSDALYAGKRWIDASPPANRQLDYRFPCTLMTGWRSVVGGVMYLGPDGLIFVPHKRNRRKAQLLEMGPLNGVTIGTADPPARNRLQRILIPHPQQVLEVQWPGGTAKFLVPSVMSTTTRLSNLTEMLRGKEA
jgi:hypothetical protein